MSVYMIVEAKKVIDEKKYSAYIKQVPKTIEKFGGKYLARGNQVEVISGNWKPERLIIVQFDSFDQFNRWWNSPDYRAVAPLREQGAKVNAIVVRGV